METAQATLIIHGGAGAREGSHARFEEYATHLTTIIEQSYPVLVNTGARAAVLHAIRLLEDDPIFNAGTGSRLQQDGQVRMSAALMDSDQQVFSGVVNIESVQHPIDIAEMLAAERHCVLAAEQATQYAHRQGIPVYDPITEHRQNEYIARVAGDKGTVGAVALDQTGVICAATSTGGVGFERPGRVSDSPTVAGNYAAQQAGVSCTGIGEQIVNHGTAVRIVTRVEDGLDLSTAVSKTIAEANTKNYKYGVISVDQYGNWCAQQTRSVTTLYAAYDSAGITTFLNVAD